MKKVLVFLFLLAVVVSMPMMTSLPPAYSVESSAQERALSFLEEVVRLDLEKYNVTLDHHSTGQVNPAGGSEPVVDEECLGYLLEGEESKLNVFLTFWDGALLYCRMKVKEGSSVFLPNSDNVLDVQQSGDVLAVTGRLMDRYRKWTGDSRLGVMKDMLTMVGSEKTTVTVGNVTLEVSDLQGYPSFYWRSTFNGVHYSQVGFGFSKGKFILGDNRAVYEIGSTEVNVSEEEAIDIALKHVKNYSYTVGKNESTGELIDRQIAEEDIVEEDITAGLKTRTREPLTLYPQWSVKLPLNQTYPGFVTGIHVGLWADTGEVIFCKTVGWGGHVEPPACDSTDSSLEDSGGMISVPVLAGVGVAVVATGAVMLGAAVYTRKRKH